MACPDRKKDQRIIAEIERRKGMEIQNSTLEPEFTNIQFSGDLSELQFLHIDQSQIVKIQRMGEQEWEIVIKNNL
jgi:hypothetical protein